MKKVAYILFGLWLSTVIMSNMLVMWQFYGDNDKLELAESESKEKSFDDSDEENEKKSDDKSDEKEKKSEKELFFYKQNLLHSAEVVAELSAKSQFSTHDEDCISSLYACVIDNPPEL